MKIKPALMASMLLFFIAAPIAHAKAFEPTFVNTLVEPYLAMQAGLAADDLSAAKTGAKAFTEAMKHAPHDGKAHHVSMNLSAAAKAIDAATDIKTVRAQFKTVSDAMLALIEQVGLTSDTTLYRAHCPMAFDNTGGSWVQGDQTIANPYFGATMLRCGYIEAKLSGKQKAANDPHAHHEH
jgi:Cu(I)/Ag(I) efflux system membrane fusion protein